MTTIKYAHWKSKWKRDSSVGFKIKFYIPETDRKLVSFIYFLFSAEKSWNPAQLKLLYCTLNPVLLSL